MKVSKLIAGGAATLLLGATGALSGCDEGGTGDPDLPPPPAIEDQNGAQQDPDPIGPAPAEEPADNANDLPALPAPEDGGGDEGDGGGLDY